MTSFFAGLIAETGYKQNLLMAEKWTEIFTGSWEMAEYLIEN